MKLLLCCALLRLVVFGEKLKRLCVVYCIAEELRVVGQALQKPGQCKKNLTTTARAIGKSVGKQKVEPSQIFQKLIDVA